jgi:hypothetical protein
VTGVVELPEDDPVIFKKFLQFLYTGTYDDDGEHPALGPSRASLKTAEEIEMELEHEQGGVCDDDVFVSADQKKSDQSQGAPTDSEFDDREVEVMMPYAGRTSENELYEPQGISYGSYMEIQADIEGADDENIDTMTDKELEYLTPHEDSTPGGLDKDEIEDLGVDVSPSKLAKDKGYHLTKSVYETSLLTSVAVYLMADKFDVPALRLFARERFYRSAQVSLLGHPDLCDIIDEIYTMTRDTDDGIRCIPSRLVGAEYIFDPGLRAKVQPVMYKHGEFATRVFHYAMYATTKAGLGAHPILTFPKRKRKSKLFPKSLRPLNRKKSRGGRLRLSHGDTVLHDS